MKLYSRKLVFIFSNEKAIEGDFMCLYCRFVSEKIYQPLK